MLSTKKGEESMANRARMAGRHGWRVRPISHYNSLGCVCVGSRALPRVYRNHARGLSHDTDDRRDRGAEEADDEQIDGGESPKEHRARAGGRRLGRTLRRPKRASKVGGATVERGVQRVEVCVQRRAAALAKGTAVGGDGGGGGGLRFAEGGSDARREGVQLVAADHPAAHRAERRRDEEGGFGPYEQYPNGDRSEASQEEEPRASEKSGETEAAEQDLAARRDDLPQRAAADTDGALPEHAHTCGLEPWTGERREKGDGTRRALGRRTGEQTEGCACIKRSQGRVVSARRVREGGNNSSAPARRLRVPRRR